MTDRGQFELLATAVLRRVNPEYEAKSNEITAIPLLLHQIELGDTLVTIDAMGCQKEIARAIVEVGGDFVIAVKDNQPKLREAIAAYFLCHLERDLEDL